MQSDTLVTTTTACRSPDGELQQAFGNRSILLGGEEQISNNGIQLLWNNGSKCLSLMVSEQEKKKVCSSCHIDKIFFFGAKQCIQNKKRSRKKFIDIWVWEIRMKYVNPAEYMFIVFQD